MMAHRRAVALSESLALRAYAVAGIVPNVVSTRWDLAPEHEPDDGVRICKLDSCEALFTPPEFRSGRTRQFCTDECKRTAYQQNRTASRRAKRAAA